MRERERLAVGLAARLGVARGLALPDRECVR